MTKTKCYRYVGHARNSPHRFKARTKQALLKKIKRETPVFAKGKKSTDFVEC